MAKKVAAIAICLVLSGCGKLGVGGIVNQAVGNWAEISLPDGCKVKLLAASDKTTAIACEDGRVFH